VSLGCADGAAACSSVAGSLDVAELPQVRE
jgi:hypothetical protein